MNAGLVIKRTRSAMRRLWSWLRQVSGDAAYETYLRHAAAGAPLTRAQFYLDAVRRQYSTPSRCC